MSEPPAGTAYLNYDGVRLHGPRSPGDRRRALMVDARFLLGAPVRGAYAHVCALTNPDASLAFDDTEVQQVRRDALAWWVPFLGDNLICLTTLALDGARYAGAITVTRRPVASSDDPFARIFPTTVLRTDLFCRVAPPAGPVIERYSGVAWPGGRFARSTIGHRTPTLN